MYTQKFVNLAWVLTFILFFGVLMLSYAFWPDQLRVYEIIAGLEITRDAFFYGALILFVLVNLAALVLRRMLEALPASSDIYAKNEAFKEHVIAWFGGLTSAVNVCLITLVGYISLFNNQADYTISDFNFLVYIGPVLLLVCVFWFFSVWSSRRRYETQ